MKEFPKEVAEQLIKELETWCVVPPVEKLLRLLVEYLKEGRDESCLRRM